MVGSVIGATHLERLKGVGETCVYHMAPVQPKPAALPDISWVA